jgi:hypothetical protein
MRKAYRGRAAAYEALGDYGRALADVKMVLTYFEVEIDVLKGFDQARADKVKLEANEVYQIRDKLVLLLPKDSPPDAVAAGTAAKSFATLQLKNNWTQAVTVVVDGTSYLVQPGQTTPITRTPGPFTYQVKDVQQSATAATLKPGETLTVWIGHP